MSALLALYGLKWNPFTPSVPVEGLQVSGAMDNFCWRIENALIKEGGFALVTGPAGIGKSATLRVLHHRLQQQRDLKVGILSHATSTTTDFYRELSELFGATCLPCNRWGSFKALRQRWLEHLESTLVQPVLMIDEAQEVRPEVLAELRLLASMAFDSRQLLTVIMAGDDRLTDKLHRPELRPLASRIRVRLPLEQASRDELMACLQHLLESAGAATLMTPELKTCLCDKAIGNRRLLTTMAQELLVAAARQERSQLDEKLFQDVYRR